MMMMNDLQLSSSNLLVDFPWTFWTGLAGSSPSGLPRRRRRSKTIGAHSRQLTLLNSFRHPVKIFSSSFSSSSSRMEGQFVDIRAQSYKFTLCFFKQSDWLVSNFQPIRMLYQAWRKLAWEFGFIGLIFCYYDLKTGTVNPTYRGV